MISVLCPTRGRPGLLKESLESLGEGDYEFLVWLDDDEPEMLEYKDILKDMPNTKVFIRPRVGYKNFHIMINELSEHAAGSWLLLWNDDALVESGNVSDLIHSYSPDKPLVINFFDPEISNLNLFPAISRAMYEAMGHYSLSTHCDSWVQDIANKIGIHEAAFGVKAIHRRNQLNDNTKADSQGAYAITSPEYDSDTMMSARLKDEQKIRELL